MKQFLGKIFLLFLCIYAVSFVFASSAQAATFQMQTGYYVGNGLDNRAITGVGFQPQLVLIKESTTGGNDGTLWRSSSMSSETTSKLGESEVDITTDAIQSLDSDGFTLGTNADVNGADTIFRWVAFAGSDCSVSGTFCVGSYTGDGVAGRSVSTGFQPNFVTIKRGDTTGASAVFKTSDMATNTTQFWSGSNESTGTTHMRTLDASGFTVGNSTNVNAASSTYWFFAFKSTTNAFAVGTFTGTGAAQSITTPGFQPNALLIKNAAATAAAPVYYNTREAYGDHTMLANDSGDVVGAITSLDSTGFSVGTNAAVNESAKTLYWIAFGGAPASTGGTSRTYKMAVGSYTGNGTGQSITGLGFRPDLVIIKNATTAQYGVFATSLMASGDAGYLANAVANTTGIITSLDADGFTVGNNVGSNTSAETYHWQAFGNAWRPDTNSGAKDFMIGSYLGNSVDNRSITNLPFTPDLLVVKRDGGNVGTMRTSAHTSGNSSIFTTGADTTDHIQNFGTNSFEVGTNNRLNQSSNATLFHYFAFKTGPDLKIGTYTAPGTATTITSPNIQPDYVWVFPNIGQEPNAFSTSIEDSTSLSFHNRANQTQRITAVTTTGFSIGTDFEVNDVNAVADYRYITWKIPTTYTQNDFEFFADEATVSLSNGWPRGSGGVDLAENTAIPQFPAIYNPPAFGDKLRIQMNLTTAGSRMGTTQQAFKLQTAQSTDCTTATSWADVGAKASGSDWRLYDESSIGDSTSQVNQISTSNNGSEGYYSEVNPSSTNPNEVPAGNNTEWDWPIQHNGASNNATHCFRMVLSDGTTLETYNADSYPKLITYPAQSQLMRHGVFYKGQEEQGMIWVD